MRKYLAALATLAILGGVTSGLAFADKGGVPNEAADFVRICHYPGHEGSYSDFFARGPGTARLCERTGGMLMTLSEQGAVNGHGAITLGGNG